MCWVGICDFYVVLHVFVFMVEVTDVLVDDLSGVDGMVVVWWKLVK